MRLKLLRELQLIANQAIRKLAKSEAYKKLHDLLISVSGIGTLTAMLLISELIDMKRFANFTNLCSYVGYIPTMADSADKENYRQPNKEMYKTILFGEIADNEPDKDSNDAVQIRKGFLS